MEDKTKLKEYIAKRAKIISVPKIDTPKEPSPWYMRPLEKNEFRYKLAKNGQYYIRHKEWSRTVWVGPYDTQREAEEIIDSYVTESLKGPIHKKVDDRVHSILIDNPETFF